MDLMTGHAYMTKPPSKPQKYGFRGLVNTWRCWESGVLQESMEALKPFPHTLPCTFLPSGCSSISFIISFNKLVNISVSLSSGSHSGKSTELEEGL